MLKKMTQSWNNWEGDGKVSHQKKRIQVQGIIGKVKVRKSRV